MTPPWLSRVTPSVIGLFFIAAAVLKIESPAQIVGAISHTLSPLIDVGLPAGAFLALALIVGEAATGLALLIAPTATVRIVGATMLCLFASVLAVRFSGHGAPPCGCLGRAIHADMSGHVWLDAARNIIFAAALVAVGGCSTPFSARTSTGADRHPKGRLSAFTLVETLVAISVVAVLVAVSIPAMRWARTESKVTKSLSAQRQIGAAVHAYVANSRDYFPHFEALDGTAGPVRMRGMTVMTGYFRAHMAYWLAAVGPQDQDLINLAIWPPLADRGPLTDDELSRGFHHSVYYLSATVAADPVAFTEPIANSTELDPRLLRGTRGSEMLFPARKGLLLDLSLIVGKPADRYVGAFGDGSAAELVASPPERIVPQPASGPQVTVMSTRNGIRGVDR